MAKHVWNGLWIIMSVETAISLLYLCWRILSPGD